MSAPESTRPEKYLVEAYLARGNEPDLPETARRARAAAEGLKGHDGSVRYLGLIFLPQEETCFYLYEAPSAEAVREASRLAGIVPERVADSVEIALEDIPQRQVPVDLQGGRR
jgi:Nickel responsive protein SCO4226-like